MMIFFEMGEKGLESYKTRVGGAENVHRGNIYGGLKMTVSDWTRGHVIPLVREEERSAKDRPRLEKIQHFFFPGVGRIYQQFEG